MRGDGAGLGAILRLLTMPVGDDYARLTSLVRSARLFCLARKYDKISRIIIGRSEFGVLNPAL